MIIVDYKCSGCGAVTEAFVARPAPDAGTCPGCGAPTRRLFTTAGLKRPDGTLTKVTGTGCVDNPDVPGLCHVGPVARKALIARYRGDDVVLAQEQRRQTEAYERSGPPALEGVASHSHG